VFSFKCTEHFSFECVILHSINGNVNGSLNDNEIKRFPQTNI